MSATPPAATTPATVGVIGGSGFYEFFESAQRVSVETPFGPPSDDLVIGRVGDRDVAFVARHGAGHRYAPHLVNYRANLWALRSVGVRQVLAPCAVGSLLPELGPGTVVIPDQVIDRTWGRPHTVWSGLAEDPHDETGPVVHVGFADPYCPRGREAATATARTRFDTVVGDGTLVVINGPRFSSRAESRLNQQAGGTIVGMTALPEAAIARELALCFTTIAMVTDHDAGVDGQEAVSHAEVLRVFAANIPKLKDVIRDTIAALPADEEDGSASCPCRRALDGIPLPYDLPR
jgi:5'-methylthioadenosine phosphorylase